MTAVEWFAEKIGHNSLISLVEYNELFEQAKQMEKEQLIIFGAQCVVESEKGSGLGTIKIYELYFNQTFKSE